MGNFTYLVKQCWFRMIPFIIAIAVYSVLVQFEKSGEGWTAAAKCAPIVALMLFVLLFGIKYLKTNAYPRRILLGLIFSCCGDAFLDFGYFEAGVGMFLLAQICYISAFGFEPYMWWIGVLLYVGVAILAGILLKYLDPISRYGLPIYGLFLVTMSWRALARMWIRDDGTVLLTRVFCGICSLLFVASDSLIAINKFYINIPKSGFYIMITYYIAQFGIALSVLPPKRLDTNQLLNEVSTPVEVSPQDIRSTKSTRLRD